MRSIDRKKAGGIIFANDQAELASGLSGLFGKDIAGKKSKRF
jgi:hypothetical protein